jgi:hypothetical protein
MAPMLKEGSNVDRILHIFNEHRHVGEDGKIFYKGFDTYPLHVMLRTFVENLQSIPEITMNRIITEAIFDNNDNLISSGRIPRRLRRSLLASASPTSSR